MNFTLMLISGQRLHFEMKGDLSDRKQGEWLRALLYFIDNPTINLGIYDNIVDSEVLGV